MGDRLTWFGHATVRLELSGTRLLTDPLLRARVAHLRRHAGEPPPPGRLDAVLISHLHRDHLDLPSLRGLDPDAPVVVPRGASAPLRRSGRELVELAVGEEHAIGDVSVLAVPAVHDGRRSPLGVEAETVGYVISAGGRRVYFAGDTERFAAMAELGALDIALLPIWGWGPKLGPGHMDPEQAAEAAALLRPRVAVPIHWGTYLPVGLHRRHEALLHTPPQTFAARCAALAPDVEVRVLEPGGSLELDRSQ
jgi:L-ascorbate metabolism protein UlaG (beta-lactamase superfamily)